MSKWNICATLVTFLQLLILVRGYPVQISLDKENKGNLNFALQLPNNDSVQIGLSFKLFTYTNTTPPIIDEGKSASTEASIDRETKKFITVDEAIEAFRQALIEKEKEIAGIIESESVFYRHFKLEFDDDIDLTIRCTYDSNYENRTLSIECYEYREFETVIISSSGEVETITQHDPDYKSDVEILNFKSMKQVYKMAIS